MATSDDSTSTLSVILSFFNRELAIALVLVCVLGLLIVPLSPAILDFLLALSISLSLVVFLVSFYVEDPVEFSVFPVLLLISTVYRLSLNISSTRLILSNGESGTEAAGNIIEAFGNVVASGNFAVGLVIFIILVIINFVVVTKGAGRIAEVAARFTLDAMPGKQMAIDADLNAGLIGDEEARQRRKDVALESDFHGAMDGASKFIRGDAIAGMLVTGINLIGGLFIGVVQHGMTFSEAARNYSVLTIGDGLVSQIPALVIAVAAGMLVTRISSDGDNLQTELTDQLFGSSKVLWVAVVILIPFIFIEGFTIPFLGIAAVVAIGAWNVGNSEVESGTGLEPADSDAALADAEDDPLQPMEVLEMEVGFDIIQLVDERRGGELMDRISRLRRQFARTLGIVIPPIHVRDNLRLAATEYSVMLRGTEVASGEIRPGYLLAIDPGGEHPQVPGIPGKEPAFGLDALWVKDEHKSQAEAAGYTVVDPATVLSTHLSEVIKKYAPEFLGRQEVQHMLDRVAKTHPKVVDDLVPNLLPLGTVLKVLKNLLREEVSVRDLLTILEHLADAATVTTDPAELTERARQALARQIANQHGDHNGTIHYINLSGRLEGILREGIQRTDAGSQLVIDPAVAQDLVSRLSAEVERQAAGKVIPVILSAPAIRGALRRLTERLLPQVAVLSPAELTDRTRLKRLATVSLA